MCVGGLLSLDVVMRGRSVRLGVVDALRPDVFVAGTLNASHADAAERARHIADGLGRIAPLEHAQTLLDGASTGGGRGRRRRLWRRDWWRWSRDYLGLVQCVRLPWR